MDAAAGYRCPSGPGWKSLAGHPPAYSRTSSERPEERHHGTVRRGRLARPGLRHGGERRPFVRKDSAFRQWVTPDGAPGPSSKGGFRAEPGRYHLYVSLACPWAYRALIMRALKGLESAIGVSVGHWLMRKDGWTFADGPGTVPDTVNGARFPHQVYTDADPRYSGRATPRAVGQAVRHHRQQRVVRGDPDARQRLRRRRRSAGRLLPRAAAGGDRRGGPRASTPR